MRNYLLQKPVCLKRVLMLFVLSLSVQSIRAQCLNEIQYLAGTHQIACTEVSISSWGSVSGGNSCVGSIGPFVIGFNNLNGGYNFTFSPPIEGVSLDFAVIDSHFNGVGHEEVSLLINGAPYAFPDNGSPNCDDYQAVVTPGGNLRCPICSDPLGCMAGCVEVNIYETINSITVSDNQFGQGGFGCTFSIRFCCKRPCLVDAGILTAQALELCPDLSASVPNATNTSLPAGSLLQYVLFSDPNDTLGSILLTSNTPDFMFNPAIMETGVTYYIAAVAAGNIGGNVNLNDPCLDFSNAIEVLWRPRPIVAFSIDNPDVCLGECATVTVTFTGDPPFSLTYTTSSGDLSTVEFTDNIGTIEVCAPLFVPSGSLTVQAIKVEDAHCICD
jgi:hypothetical protein